MVGVCLRGDVQVPGDGVADDGFGIARRGFLIDGVVTLDLG